MLKESPSRGYVTAILAVVIMCGLVAVSFRASYSTLLFLRRHGLLAASESGEARLVISAIGGQVSILAGWLIMTTFLATLSRFWLSDVRSRLRDIWLLVAVAHLPVMLWTLLAAGTTHVAIETFNGLAAAEQWPREVTALAFVRFARGMLLTKILAYGGAIALCARLFGTREQLSPRLAWGLVGASAGLTLASSVIL